LPLLVVGKLLPLQSSHLLPLPPISNLLYSRLEKFLEGGLLDLFIGGLGEVSSPEDIFFGFHGEGLLEDRFF
jgi:hypothetical protein